MQGQLAVRPGQGNVTDMELCELELKGKRMQVGTVSSKPLCNTIVCKALSSAAVSAVFVYQNMCS
jgi:hypothetical protein